MPVGWIEFKSQWCIINGPQVPTWGWRWSLCEVGGGGCGRVSLWRGAGPREQAASEPVPDHSWLHAGGFLQDRLLHTCDSAPFLSGPCCRWFILPWSLPEAGLGETVCREVGGNHTPSSPFSSEGLPSEESGKHCLAWITCLLLSSFEELRAPSRQDVLHPQQLPEAESDFDPLSHFFFNRWRNDSPKLLMSVSQLAAARSCVGVTGSRQGRAALVRVLHGSKTSLG